MVDRRGNGAVFFCGEMEGELKELVDRITQWSVTPERGVFCVGENWMEN